MVMCFDNNNQIFPLVFGVGDLYIWFFERFKEAYNDIKGLALIIDKYKGLEKAIAKLH